MQNKRSFVGEFFELFTLPVSLRLNTHRRIPPSMRAFKEEERSILISVTLMKGITGYKTRSTRSVCKWRVQSWDGYLKERFLSLIVCLFILCYIFLNLLSTFFVFFSSYSFCYLHFFFPSAFFYPHFPIRIRHPPVSGPRFTDTQVETLSIYFVCFCHFLKLPLYKNERGPWFKKSQNFHYFDS